MPKVITKVKKGKMKKMQNKLVLGCNTQNGVFLFLFISIMGLQFYSIMDLSIGNENEKNVEYDEDFQEKILKNINNIIHSLKA